MAAFLVWMFKESHSAHLCPCALKGFSLTSHMYRRKSYFPFLFSSLKPCLILRYYPKMRDFISNLGSGLYFKLYVFLSLFQDSLRFPFTSSSGTAGHSSSFACFPAFPLPLSDLKKQNNRKGSIFEPRRDPWSLIRCCTEPQSSQSFCHGD